MMWLEPFANGLSLYLLNESALPAFDVDVWLFPTFDSAEMPPHEFATQFFREEEKGRAIGTLNEDEVEGGFYALADRILRHRLPAGTALVARSHSPLPSSFVYVVLQFRSPLGVNYGQLLQFGRTESEYAPHSPRYVLGSVAPDWPTPGDRIELTLGTQRKRRLRRWPTFVSHERKIVLRLAEKAISVSVTTQPRQDMEERGELRPASDLHPR
jgi:hypothetical protein